MKQLLFLLFSIILVFGSCKSNNDELEEAKYAYLFASSAPASSAELADMIDVLTSLVSYCHTDKDTFLKLVNELGGTFYEDGFDDNRGGKPKIKFPSVFLYFNSKDSTKISYCISFEEAKTRDILTLKEQTAEVASAMHLVRNDLIGSSDERYVIDTEEINPYLTLRFNDGVRSALPVNISFDYDAKKDTDH